jgi:hypothetical protein
MVSEKIKKNLQKLTFLAVFVKKKMIIFGGYS